MTAGWQLRIIFVLLIVGLGVKAALVPLHGWLPAAMVAPAPVSALLHAVAVVKAGAFGMVRVIYDVYGFAPAKQLGVLEPLAWMAAATVIYGSLRALHQDELKKRLAYSTVSQVSYIALGCAVGGPLATLGGIVHLVHQGLMKITLFFCAGNIAENLGRHRVSELKGVGRRLPLTMAAFTLGALGMIGVPPLAGFITKWYLAVGCLSTGQWWVILVLAASSALNAAYFLPILYTAWFQEPDAAWPEEARPGWREVPWMLLVPPLVTAGLAVAAGILASALPLHVWLPLAHPAAPTPSSAVLSGAMIKAGLLGWLRFLPLGGAFLSEWGLLFVGAGLLAALGGVMVGLTQRNLKTVLAYSSISQMGLMTVGVGLALLLPERVPEAVAAVAVTACHHGLTKGALFLGVGMIDAVPRSSRRRVWLHAGLSWCALALAGFPLTGGFLAKGLIKDVAVLLPPPWSDLVNLFLPLTAGGTALLMLHFLSLAIRSPGSGGAGAGRWLSWHAILGCVVVVAWMLPESAAGKASALDAARWWAAFWPAALALLMTLGFQALRRATGRSLSVAVPPGDILAIMGLLQRPLAKIRSVAGAVTAVLDRGLALCLLECWNDCFGGFTRLAGRWQLEVLEEGLMRFAVAGTLVVVALVILLLFLWQPPM